MQNFALRIFLTNGDEIGGFGTAGSRNHRAAEDIRDNWQDIRSANPNNFYTLAGPAGEPMNVRAGDIAEVRVVVGAEY